MKHEMKHEISHHNIDKFDEGIMGKIQHSIISSISGLGQINAPLNMIMEFKQEIDGLSATMWSMCMFAAKAYDLSKEDIAARKIVHGQLETHIKNFQGNIKRLEEWVMKEKKKNEH